MPQGINIIFQAAEKSASAWSLKDVAPWAAVLATTATLAWSVWVRLVDLRWKRSESIRAMFSEAKEDEKLQAAVDMLDVRGYDLYDSKGETLLGSVHHSDIFNALSTVDVEHAGTSEEWSRQLRIRQCFDALFDFLTELEFGVRSKQIPFHLIKDRCHYWVAASSLKRKAPLSWGRTATKRDTASRCLFSTGLARSKRLLATGNPPENLHGGPPVVGATSGCYVLGSRRHMPSKSSSQSSKRWTVLIRHWSFLSQQ